MRRFSFRYQTNPVSVSSMNETIKKTLWIIDATALTNLDAIIGEECEAYIKQKANDYIRNHHPKRARRSERKS